MAAKLIIALRWTIIAALIISLALIIIRWRFPAAQSAPGDHLAWLKDLWSIWRNHREDQRELNGNLRALRGKTALLVDPNPKSLRVMTWKLERLGCTVFEAQNGAQALSVAREQAIDMLFADSLLSDISAIDFYNSLPNKTIPIIFLGATIGQWDNLRALGSSVAILARPFDPTQAASQAGQILRRQPPHGSAGASPSPTANT
ncbi:MAG: response regulator [Armatimonadetes bacterium]|nr:response regulator [Armatimonadota bacterium]